MFTPDLDLKVITRCSKFSINEKTGVDTGDGTKWAGTSGLDPADLTTAVIKIINPSGVQSGTDVDVLSQIVSNVTGTFSTWWFNDITGTLVDGLHNIIYKLQIDGITITAYSDYSATVFGTVRCTSNGHALVTGMYVDITGSTNYNGEYYVTRIDANTFYITAEWVADDGSSTASKGYKSTFYPYVYCRSEAGVDKMYANLARMKSGNTRKKYQDDANTAWALLQSLKSAISSSNIDALISIQEEIDQILEFYDVDPNL